MSIMVRPASASVGAEILGVDLATMREPSLINEIKAAVHANSMVYLRGQRLGNEQFIEFSRHFGPSIVMGQPTLNLADFQEISRVSNILENGAPIGLIESGQYWHTDRSFHAVPQGYAMLHAIEVPRDENGKPLGDTIFVSTAHAYDTLPDSVRQRIAGMKAVHSYQNPYKKKLSAGRDNMIRLAEHHKPPISHPVVRTHPVTGRKCLYVNQQYTMGIEGMPDTEARELIDYLCQHITREEAWYRHQWAEGDLVIWDDCSAQHNAVGDYKLPQRRLLHRIGIQGTVPV